MNNYAVIHGDILSNWTEDKLTQDTGTHKFNFWRDYFAGAKDQTVSLYKGKKLIKRVTFKVEIIEDNEAIK